ncbi:MAG: lipoprotein [Proteobacteria bacterium]|nr:lipoprotein [Pseudomonadota bacterium]
MLRAHQILARTIALALSAVALGCGQRGPLYLPTEPAAAQRATLPETLNPAAPRAPAPTTPSTAPSSTP